jgi:hypothetical protein
MIGAISDENAQRSTRLRKATARQALNVQHPIQKR